MFEPHEMGSSPDNDAVPITRRLSLHNERTHAVPKDHEERRRLLFETPWGTRLGLPIPGERPSVQRQPVNPLDCLSSLDMAFETHHDTPLSLLDIGSSTKSHLPYLDDSCLPIEELVQVCSEGQFSISENPRLLEYLVSTRHLSETELLLSSGHILTLSSLPTTRETGYTLFYLIPKYHSPFSTLQRHCAWMSISSHGMEVTTGPRQAQMSALASLVSSREIYLLNNCIKQMLDWMNKTDDLVHIIECHNIVQALIIDRLEDHWAHKIVETYCKILSRSMELDSPTPLGKAKRIIVHFRQIIELLVEQELFPDSALVMALETLCLILGSGGERTPSAFGEFGSDETSQAYRHAAELARSLLKHNSYRLPVLETFETILQFSTNHSSTIRIGALNAIAERVWSGLVNRFENNSLDGIPSKPEDGNVPLDDEISILQDLPDRWIGKTGSNALFTRVLKLVRQFVETFDSQTSPSVRRFLNIHITRVAALVTKLCTPEGSPLPLNLSQTTETAYQTPLISEIEGLLAVFLNAPSIPASWAYAFLNMSRHLCDCDLVVAIKASQERASPVHVDWSDYFKLFMQIYRENDWDHPASRRAIIACIEAQHEAIVDVRVFHDEVSEDLATLLEETLPNTRDESLLNGAFRILRRELVAVISGDYPEDKLESQLQRICNGWIRLAFSECSCRPRNHKNNGNSPYHISDPGSSQFNCLQHILAVKFLIDAFSEMAFTNSKSPSISVTNSGSYQASIVSKFALSLFKTLLSLMGTRSVRKDTPRISCVRARLAVLQWALRIRADCEHRIFIYVGDLPAVVSLAELAQRLDSSTSIAPFWKHNDVDFDLQIQRRREQRRLKRRKGVDATRRRQSSVAGNSSDRSTTDTDSSSDELEQDDGPYLWQLPDQLMVDITDEMTRPSPAITTCHGDESDDQSIKLPVHHYLSSIIEILAHCRNWGIVSYILCHLPSQLSNKRLFYGGDTNQAMRRLVIGVCGWIKGDSFYDRMDHIKPADLSQSAIQAILYHCLTVLLSYHNWLEPLGRKPEFDATLNYTIVESLVHGLSGDEMARRPCLEALSIAIYRVPEEVAKFSTLIIEKLASLATNPLNSVQIVEYLLISGYTPRLHVGLFRDIDYQRVFGIALMYIQQRSRSDADTITTLDGKESYSLAQHIYRTSYILFYIWISAMRVENRARFITFISNGLQDAANGDKMSALSECCMDWLMQYAYATVDPFPWSRFMYTSIAFPGYGSRAIPEDWMKRRKLEKENVADSRAWKMGNSIMRVSSMKFPVGWARVTVIRPSGRMELYCHLEGVRSSGYDEIASTDEVRLGMAQTKVSPGFHPMAIPSIFSNSITPLPSNMRAYESTEKLTQTAAVLRQTPVVYLHRVGILYIAPGQTAEEEILANTHGSLTYSHFISRIGQLVDLSAPDNFFASGLRAGSHGRYTIAWVDDISSINFHVATMMPNFGDNTSKKGPIGNDSVKIIWNDGGRPYEFSTFRSAFNLINIVIEPQSSAQTSAYRASIDGFLRVTLQTAPGMPRLTPIGDFKNVRLDYLPEMLRHCTLLACLFCESWMCTGMDGPVRNPLETNWTSRLACIERSEKHLEPEVLVGN